MVRCLGNKLCHDLFPGKEAAIERIESSCCYSRCRALDIDVALRGHCVDVDVKNVSELVAFIKHVIFNVRVPARLCLCGGIKHVAQHEAGRDGRHVNLRYRQS